MEEAATTTRALFGESIETVSKVNDLNGLDDEENEVDLVAYCSRLA